MTSGLITLNTGSSSVRAGVYDAARLDVPVLRLEVDRIHGAGAVVRVSAAGEGQAEEYRLEGGSFEGALKQMAGVIRKRGFEKPVAVGHRIVHGGPDHARPEVVRPDLLARLRELVPVDPEHLPQALAGIETMQQAFPQTLQIACFDTAFHRDMPQVAQLYGLPYRLGREGVLRYGFHGLSYESILAQLRALGDLPDRIVVAHLGNGSSAAAVYRGQSVDTTMGFSPTSGLVMGTRSGDVDPTAVLYLLESRGMAPDELRRLLNRESGLLGVSGSTSDMRALLGAAASDQRAELAVDLYCYVARKHLASMVAALGGLDVLVFTGGIGEHAAEIRERACSHLGFLGISLNSEKNRVHAPVVSVTDSVTVRVMHTDEEAVIARHTAEFLNWKDSAANVHV